MKVRAIPRKRLYLETKLTVFLDNEIDECCEGCRFMEMHANTGEYNCILFCSTLDYYEWNKQRHPLQCQSCLSAER